ncbi:MAG: hypothetical protein JWP47_35 [Polaromonas sp.]|jgi:hypothetical protein|nr:hypothetical protein [Polaromonas sp.]
MNEPSALEKLHEAVRAEHVADADRARRYEHLTAKMRAYQEGEGPAPTIDEFMDWRDRVEERIALKKLHAGITDDEVVDGESVLQPPT